MTFAGDSIKLVLEDGLVVSAVTDTQGNMWWRNPDGSWQCVLARALTAADSITLHSEPIPNRPTSSGPI